MTTTMTHIEWFDATTDIYQTCNDTFIASHLNCHYDFCIWLIMNKKLSDHIAIIQFIINDGRYNPEIDELILLNLVKYYTIPVKFHDVVIEKIGKRRYTYYSRVEKYGIVADPDENTRIEYLIPNEITRILCRGKVLGSSFF